MPDSNNDPMGTVRGHAGVRQVLEPLFAPIHENEFLVLRKAANSAFEVHDGRIAVWRNHFDLASAAKIHDAGAA